MAMTFTSPAGRTYTWSKDTPPTADDWAALQAHDAELDKASAPPAAEAAPAPRPLGRAPTDDEMGMIRAAPETGVMTRIRESLSPLLGNTDAQQLRQDSHNAGMGVAGRPQTWQEKGALPSVASAAGDAVLGIDHLPSGQELKNMGAVTAGSTLGQLAGARLGKPGQMAGGFLGGGGASAIMELLKDGNVDIGKIVADAIASANSSRKVGSNAATNAIAANVNSLINTGELAGTKATFNAAKGGAMAAAIAQRLSAPDVPAVGNAEREAALAGGRKMGLKAIPSSVGDDSLVTTALETLGGRGALKDAAQAANNEGAAVGARAHAGLDVDEALNADNLRTKRGEVAQPFTEAKQLGDDARTALEQHLATKPGAVSDPHAAAIVAHDPAFDAITKSLQTQAGADFPGLQQAMHDLNDAYRAAKTAAEREPIRAKVEQLSQAMVDAAKESGDPGLIDRIAKARTLMAKTYDIEDALNHGDGSVDLSYLGRAYQRNPGKMTGEAADLGRFANAFQRSGVIGDGRVKMAPGNSGTNAAAIIAGLVKGGGSLALKMTGVPAARAAARKILLSEPYQNTLVNKMAESPQTVRAAMVRMLVEDAARNESEKKK